MEITDEKKRTQFEGFDYLHNVTSYPLLLPPPPSSSFLLLIFLPCFLRASSSSSSSSSSFFYDILFKGQNSDEYRE